MLYPRLEYRVTNAGMSSSSLHTRKSVRLTPFDKDISILSTALPAITNEFHSLDDIGWYGSSYLMATAAFQLPLGKAYTTFSPFVIFLSSIVVFEIGSIVSATAQSSNALILGRAIAGFGDSGIWAGTLV